MKKVIAYQLAALAVVGCVWLQIPLQNFPDWLTPYTLPVECILIGVVGGCLYCLRAVYLNRSVRNQWNSEWEVWYFLRPIVSGISGLVAYTFLNAGLIILEADKAAGSGDAGYLVFSLIAGLNVDKFVQRVEEVAKATFGVEKSNANSSDREK